VKDLLESLREGGLPCTVEGLKGRFALFVRQSMRLPDFGP